MWTPKLAATLLAYIAYGPPYADFQKTPVLFSYADTMGHCAVGTTIAWSNWRFAMRDYLVVIGLLAAILSPITPARSDEISNLT